MFGLCVLYLIVLSALIDPDLQNPMFVILSKSLEFVVHSAMQRDSPMIKVMVVDENGVYSYFHRKFTIETRLVVAS